MRPKNKEQIFIGMIRAGIFEVDNEGCVWRLAVRDCAHRITPVARKRAERRTVRGYLALSASVGNRKIVALAHRIIWIYLHGPIPNGLEMNHKDGNKANNQPGNLELVTASQNQKHAYRIIKTHQPKRGEENGFSKLTNNTVIDIRRRRAKGESLSKMAAEYSVSYYTAWDAVKRRWKHIKEGA